MLIVQGPSEKNTHAKEFTLLLSKQTHRSPIQCCKMVVNEIEPLGHRGFYRVACFIAYTHHFFDINPFLAPPVTIILVKLGDELLCGLILDNTKKGRNYTTLV